MTNAFSITTNNGISGSITKLADGSSYLVAGPGVQITSQSNGQILIEADAGGTTVDGIFGDGSDGNVTLSVDTTLTRDMYYSSLTIPVSKALYPNGFRIFVAGPCIVSGTIDNSGFGATNNVSTGGEPGAIGSIGGGTVQKGKGGNAPSGAGGPSNTGINSVNAVGGAGASGGSGGAYNVCPASQGSIRSLPNAINCWVPNLADGTFNGISGGAGGGASPGSTGGGGGGGVIVLAAANIQVLVSGSISANGGPGAGDSAGGSGGAGGGLIVLVSQQAVENSGNISVNGGVGGTGFSGSPGNGGANGAVIQLISR